MPCDGTPLPTPRRVSPTCVQAQLAAGWTQGHLECVQALVEAGADVNNRMSRKQRTALHVAAQRGHVEVRAPCVCGLDGANVTHRVCVLGHCCHRCRW